MVTGVDQAQFTLTYDGPALEEGRMAVREPGPALLGLSEIFQEANLAVNPTGPPINLEVQAFRQGSFAIYLHIVQTLVQRMIHLLNTPEATALVNLLQNEEDSPVKRGIGGT